MGLNIHKVKNMKYIQRIIEPLAQEYAQQFPVTSITGPRQSGKSTLIQHLFQDYHYISFDDYRMREFIDEDPIGFINTYQNRIIFDEAQKCPEIFNLIKIAVDRDRQHYGKFIVTGSSQFSLLKQISESLAGRIGLLTLLPLQFSEIPTALHQQAIYKGGYPELVLRHYTFSEQWFGSYLETYLNKDLRDIKDIGNLRDFRRLLNLLAANTTQTLNMSHFANDIGVSVPTVKSWISALEASYIIFLLPPYYKNYGKRITKNPKIYFYDTGLAAFLTAVNTEAQYRQGPLCGPLFENYVVSEILKKEKHQGSHAELYYYRTSNGVEIDLIVDRKQSRDLIEIKHSESFTSRMLTSLFSIEQAHDQCYVLYNGEALTFSKTAQALHYSQYLKI